MVKITRETALGMTEPLEHTSTTTFGIAVSVAITKGYLCIQDTSGNASLSVGGSSIGKIIGVADESVTGSTTAGEKLIRIIDHRYAWVTACPGPITYGQPVIASSTAGMIAATYYGSADWTDRYSLVLGDAMTATTNGSAQILVRFRF